MFRTDNEQSLGMSISTAILERFSTETEIRRMAASNEARFEFSSLDASNANIDEECEMEADEQSKVSL